MIRETRVFLLIFVLIVALIPVTHAQSGNVVATGTEWHMIGYTNQRHNFITATHHFVFYYNASWFVYRSSTNESVWSSEQQVFNVGANSRGSCSAIHFNGSVVHVTAYQAVSGGIVYYRMGTPLNNGSIVWSAPTQTVIDFALNEQLREASIDISATETGYPFISWSNTTLIAPSGTYPVVYRSSTNNGTWTTDTAFQLDTTSNTNWKTDIVCLENESMYLMYWIFGSTVVRGRYFNGSTWSSEHTLVTGTSIQMLSTVGDKANNLVHLTYNDNDIQYRFYEVALNTWSSEILVDATPTVSEYPMISQDTTNNTLHIFYGDWTTDYIYTYHSRWGATWDARRIYVDETTDKLSWTNYYHVSEVSRNNTIGVFWMAKDYGNPYDLKYLALAVSTEPISDEAGFNWLPVAFLLGLALIVMLAVTKML